MPADLNYLLQARRNRYANPAGGSRASSEDPMKDVEEEAFQAESKRLKEAAKEQAAAAEDAAKAYESGRKAAEKEALRARNNEMEAKARREKRPIYTDADGRIQSQYTDEEWEAKKKLKAKNDQLRTQYFKENRPWVEDAEGNMIARHTDEEWNTLKAEKAAKEKAKLLDEQAKAYREQKGQALTNVDDQAAQVMRGLDLEGQDLTLKHKAKLDTVKKANNQIKVLEKEIEDGETEGGQILNAAELAKRTAARQALVAERDRVQAETDDAEAKLRAHEVRKLEYSRANNEVQGWLQKQKHGLKTEMPPVVMGVRGTEPEGLPQKGAKTAAKKEETEAYGYPIKSAQEMGLDEYLKSHPEVAGMAWGGGENDSDPDEPRVIVVNPHNKYMSDPEKRGGLAKIEAARHKMSEVGYEPDFSISPEQQEWRKKLGPYATDDKAFKQSIVSRLLAHDEVPGVTAEQKKAAEEFEATHFAAASRPSQETKAETVRKAVIEGRIAALAEDDSLSDEERKKGLTRLMLQRDDPKAYETQVMQEFEGLPPEQLNQALDTHVQDFEMRKQDWQARRDALKQQTQAVNAEVDSVLARNAQRLQQPHKAADLIEYTTADGVKVSVFKDLAPQLEQAQEKAGTFEKQHQAEMDQINAEGGELERAAKLIHAGGGVLQKKHETAQVAAKAERQKVYEQLNTLPGAKLGDELARVDEAVAKHQGGDDVSLHEWAAKEREKIVAKAQEVEEAEQGKKREVVLRKLEATGNAGLAGDLALIHMEQKAKADRINTSIQRGSDEHQAALAALEEETQARLKKAEMDAALVPQKAAELYQDFFKDYHSDYVDWTTNTGVNDKQFPDAKEGRENWIKHYASKAGIHPKDLAYQLEMQRGLDFSKPLTLEADELQNRLGYETLKKFGKIGEVEPTRVLPNGMVAVNPALGGDADEFEQVIKNTVASPKAKDEARKLWPAYHAAWLDQAAETLSHAQVLPGVEDFNEWTARKLDAGKFMKDGPNGKRVLMTQQEQTQQYIDEMKGRWEVRKLLDNVSSSLMAGSHDILTAIYGTGAILTSAAGKATGWSLGGETLSKLAGDKAQQAEALLAGHSVTGTDTLFGSKLAGGAISQTARILPGMAPTIATGSMTGAMIAGGMQTGGIQYADTYRHLRSGPNPLTHDEAFVKAAPAAVYSGIMTAVLTKAFPGGLTALNNRANQAVLRQSIGQAIKSYASGSARALHAMARGTLDEVPQEVMDEFNNQMSQAMVEGTDPKKAVSSFLANLPELIIAAGAAGGLGGLGAIDSNSEEAQPGVNPTAVPAGISPADAADIDEVINNPQSEQDKQQVEGTLPPPTAQQIAKPAVEVGPSNRRQQIVARLAEIEQQYGPRADVIIGADGNPDQIRPRRATTPEEAALLKEVEGINAAETPNSAPTSTADNGVSIDNLDTLVANSGGIVQVSQSGRKVAYTKFGLAIEGDTAEVAFVELATEERGKGIGYETYVALGKSLAAKGITLQSSKAQYRAGRKLWEKLAAQGLATKGAQGVYSFTAPAEQFTSSTTTPDFKNVVHDTPAIQIGKANPEDHVTEAGYAYRTMSQAELEDMRKHGELRANPSGKSKGGRKNVKHWDKGGGGRFYRKGISLSGGVVVRVPLSKMQEGKPVSAQDVEVMNTQDWTTSNVTGRVVTPADGKSTVEEARAELAGFAPEGMAGHQVAATKAKAEVLLRMAQGETMADFTDEELRTVGLNRDGTPGHYETVPVDKKNPDAGRASVWKKGVRPDGFQPVVADKGGELIITQRQIDNLKKRLPAVAAQIGKSEVERRREIAGKAEDNQTGRLSDKESQLKTGAPGATSETATGKESLTVAAFDPAVETRVDEIATELSSRGLSGEQALKAARGVVQRMGVQGPKYEVQMIDPAFEEAMKAEGFQRDPAKMTRWMAKGQFKAETQAEKAARREKAVPEEKTKGTERTPESQSQSQNAAGKSARITPLIERSDWKQAQGEVIAAMQSRAKGLPEAGKKAAADKIKAVVKRFNKLEELIDTKFGRLFEGVRIVPNGSLAGGGLAAQVTGYDAQGRATGVELLVDAATFAEAGGVTDAELERTLNEEWQHRADLMVMSRSEAIDLAKAIHAAQPGVFNAAWKQYYAVQIKDGSMPAKPPVDLTDDEAYMLYFEASRMIRQGTFTTENAAIRDVGLLQRMYLMLSRYVNFVRREMKKLPQDLRELWEDKLTAAEGVMNKTKQAGIRLQKEHLDEVEPPEQTAPKPKNKKPVQQDDDEEALAMAADAEMDVRAEQKGALRNPGENAIRGMAAIPDPDTGKENVVVWINRYHGRITRPSKGWLARMAQEGKDRSKIGDWDDIQQAGIPSFYASLVFKNGNGSTLDQALQELHGMGYFPGVAAENVTGEMLASKIMDVIQRYQAKKQGGATTVQDEEQAHFERMEAQRVEFERSTAKGPIYVKPHEMQPGDVMMVKADDGKMHRVEVLRLDTAPVAAGEEFDPDANPAQFMGPDGPMEIRSVTLKDGTTFGVQTIDGQQGLYVDAFSVRQEGDFYAGLSEAVQNRRIDDADAVLHVMQHEGMDATTPFSQIVLAIQQNLRVPMRRAQKMLAQVMDTDANATVWTNEELKAALESPLSSPRKQGVNQSSQRTRHDATFSPPIQTPHGALERYTWQHKLEDVWDNRAGEYQTKRISDWDKAVTNAETGRDIVHHFDVLKPDGTRHTVSLETALGALTPEQKKSTTSTIRALRRLPMNEALLQDLETKRTAYLEAWKQAEQEGWKSAPDIQLQDHSFPARAEEGLKEGTIDGQWVGNYTPNEIPLSAQAIRQAKTRWATAKVEPLKLSYEESNKLDSLPRIIKKDRQTLKNAGVTTNSQPLASAEAGQALFAPKKQGGPGLFGEDEMNFLGDRNTLGLGERKGKDNQTVRQSDGETAGGVTTDFTGSTNQKTEAGGGPLTGTDSEQLPDFKIPRYWIDAEGNVRQAKKVFGIEGGTGISKLSWKRKPSHAVLFTGPKAKAEQWIQEQGGKLLPNDGDQSPSFAKATEDAPSPEPGFALEATTAQELKAEAERKVLREKLQARAEKPLVGTLGDIGQTQMFGGGDLFAQAGPPITHVMPDGYVLTEPGMTTLHSPRKRAYHGTPHKVDRFSTDKIGTGEGAQAYGWGLYFAGNKAVAQQYQKGLTERDFIRKIREEFSEHDDQETALELIHGLDLSEGQRALIDALAKEDWWGFDFPHQAVQAAIREPQNFDPGPDVTAALEKFGNLYTVDLLPDEAEFLDWDKPLAEQSENIRSILRKNGLTETNPDVQWEAQTDGKWGSNGLSPTGESLYKALKISGDKAASDKLLKLGIPGIRYLDGNSRGDGEGSSNYVLFDEKLVRIIAENGKPVETQALASPRKQAGDGSQSTLKREQRTGIDAAAHEAATSPRNDLPEPTQAQKEAGNYAKGHASIGGHEISIENPAGSKRRPEWPVLKDHYGYLKGTVGQDGDHVDVFVKPGTPADYAGPVHVVRQNVVENGKATGKLDEYKVLLGYPTADEAKAAYLRNYTPGWPGLAKLTTHTMPEFEVIKRSVFGGDAGARATDKVLASAQKQGKSGGMADPEQAAQRNEPSPGGLTEVRIKAFDAFREARREAENALDEDRAAVREGVEVFQENGNDFWDVFYRGNRNHLDYEPDGSFTIWYDKGKNKWMSKGDDGFDSMPTADDSFDAAVDWVKQQFVEDWENQQQDRTFGQWERGKDEAFNILDSFTPPPGIVSDQRKPWEGSGGLGPSGSIYGMFHLESDPDVAWKLRIADHENTSNLHVPPDEQFIVGKNWEPASVEAVMRSAWDWLAKKAKKSQSVPQSGRTMLGSGFSKTGESNASPFSPEVNPSFNPSRAEGGTLAAPRKQSKPMELMAKADWGRIDKALTGRLAKAVTDAAAWIKKQALPGEAQVNPMDAALELLAGWSVEGQAAMSGAKLKPAQRQELMAQTRRQMRRFWNKAVRQIVPDASLPADVLAKKREMTMNQALSNEVALDIGKRALVGKPKLSDLVVGEAQQNPEVRRKMFLAMNPRIDSGVTMASLNPEERRVAEALLKLRDDLGKRMVKAGRIGLQTYEAMREGTSHYYDRDVKREKSMLRQMSMGLRNLFAQTATAYHIVDTQTKQPDGSPALVMHPGTRNRPTYRFDTQEQMRGFYEEFLKDQILQAAEKGNAVRYPWMTPADKDALRGVTRDSLNNPGRMSAEQRAVVARLQEQLRDRFEKRMPLSYDEHSQAGLIEDPFYSVARQIAEMGHDVATAEFFNSIAAVPDYVRDAPTIGYTEMPDTAKLGALAGKHVRDDVAAEVQQLTELPGLGMKFYDALLGLFKTGKTVLNPGSHGRNIVGNIAFAHLAGSNPLNPGNATYYAEALRVLRDGGADYREMYESGVLGGDFLTGEVKRSLRQLVPDAATVLRDAESGNMSWLYGLKEHMARRFQGLLKKPGQGLELAATAWRLEDDIYKAAAYLKAKGMGMTSKAAAEHVREWFPYYDKGTSGTLKFLGRLAFPFLSFKRESFRILKNGLTKKPLATIATLALPRMLTQIALTMAEMRLLMWTLGLGLKDDRDKEDVLKALKGRAGRLLSPIAGDSSLFSILLPWRDDNGGLQQWDLSNTHPFGDWLATRTEDAESKEPWVARQVRELMTGSPFLGLLVEFASNQDSFTGRRIYESDMSSSEATDKLLEHAFTELAPPLTPTIPLPGGVKLEGTSARTIRKAFEQSPSKLAPARNPTQAMIRALVGLDVRPADPNRYENAAKYREEHNLPAVPRGQQFPSDAVGRARAELYRLLIQPEPDVPAVKDQLEVLKKHGAKLPSVKDLFEDRQPQDVMKLKKHQARWINQMAPEMRRGHDAAVKQQREAYSRALDAMAKARAGG